MGRTFKLVKLVIWETGITLSVGYHVLARFTGSFSGFVLPCIYTLTISIELSNQSVQRH
jgi:hypothetical protein